MSLAVKENRGGRSRSRSRDRRPKDEPAREKPQIVDVREPEYAYPEDDSRDRYKTSRYEDSTSRSSALVYPGAGGIDDTGHNRQSRYSYEDAPSSSYRNASPPSEPPYRSSRDKMDSQLPGSFPEDDGRKDDYDYDRRARRAEIEDPRYSSRKLRDDDDGRRDRHEVKPSRSGGYDVDGVDSDKLKYLPGKYSRRYEEDDDDTRHSNRADDRKKDRHGKDGRYDEEDDDARHSYRADDRSKDRRSKTGRYDEDAAYGRDPPLSSRAEERRTYGSYLGGSHSEEKRSSRHHQNDSRDDSPEWRKPASPAADEYGSRRSHRDSHNHDPRSSAPSVLTVDPSTRGRDKPRDRGRDSPPGPSALTVAGGRRERDRSSTRQETRRDKSPQPPTARMSSLMVNTGRPSKMTIAEAPGSPLLESYRGTYQDCSPMPSPLLMASQHPSSDSKAVEIFSPLGSDHDGDGKKRNRRARFHDPEDIASRLARALKGDKAPDTEPLIEILPSLTHDQVMELRDEYKQLVKTGSDRKGVNIAKHIRSRLKDEDPNLMKACYSVALGMWEGEAYWANFWYQGDKTRREMLIESLMGRPNEEIRYIKDAFKDKKYDNSLTKCMKTELKEDKFKKAVLMVLEERRMEEVDHNGRPLPIDYELVDRDVDDLRKSVKAEKGGESSMISIIVKRSDSHLRYVLKEYERQFHTNFAREALKKSGNLVGELLAHILNGVINRPVRDALLLHHAVSASRKDELRRELLISRLVRFHWEAAHMQAIKKAFRERYGRDLLDAVREASSGKWGQFCEELCIARIPNDVRRVERVEIIK